MIRDLEGVDQLVTRQVLRLEPIICDVWINVQAGRATISRASSEHEWLRIRKDRNTLTSSPSKREDAL
jgi:hypothetical protein